ncbi:Small nuclear ribonucleoprotein Sm D3 isoform 1 [Schistosoma japonicum]|uniref:Small nuclear ribonucleoprotein Sm D3 n=1 Tax=Schistosoma japonicum TaxID=6182 RepID=A0A4Z2DLM2_SCHJA|nr:Small nuclear ribonucleoprotein Sm D3 [Schistosoma japonicum]TNN17454.1 Small nuclear ribonucleoprotein Sm D3 isoform 1 [Schistosoma japonicum]
MSVGIPIKVLHDAEGHVVTLETVSGEVFRGKLVEAEDNMNVHMCDLIMTSRDGRTSNLQQVYIRGSKIRFLILPDMLKNSPMLKRPQGAKGLGTGRGKNAMLRAGGKFLYFELILHQVRGRGTLVRGRVATVRGTGKTAGRF